MKKIIKIISGIVAFILITGILWLANGFLGNPISKFLANKSAKKYIEEKYIDMDLEIDKAKFDFKSGGYSVFVKSPNSIDTHFSIRISSTGDVMGDSYGGDVLGKFNTWNRINSQYREMVDAVFEAEDFPYKGNIDYGDLKLKEKASPEFITPIYGLDRYELELDKIYDIKELGKETGHIVFYLEDNKLDSKRAGEVLLHIKDIFDKKDLPFYAIDLSLEEPKTEENKRNRETFSVREFLYSDIYQDNLIERLEKAKKDLEDYYEIEDSKKDKLNY